MNGNASGSAEVEMVIEGRQRSLGGFDVRRVLPSARRQMVGPFIFFDEIGPATFSPGEGIDVRPHPHIGLATVTYLFDGEILHRDSLGTVQPIRPGDVNWMSAGCGIVHSERTSPARRAQGGPLAGIQAWIALPQDTEDSAPSFTHYPSSALPTMIESGCRLRLIAGTFLGARSPTATHWETLYADAALDSGARLPLARTYPEQAIYLVAGAAEVAGRALAAGSLMVLAPGSETTIVAHAPSRLMLIGGAAMDGPRHLWWNFVSSSVGRIEQARADWRDGRFPPVPGDAEFIPLPED